MDIASTPFDQYTRQVIVKNIIENCIKKNIPKIKGKKIRILDVGGYKGITAEIMSQDEIIVLDVFDIDEDNYIKGDATKMAFSDKSFDIVCSFDVFEHIPKEKRLSFIRECSRVSEIGFFIAAPMNDKFNLVTYAEEKTNDLFKMINETDHRWLSEHIQYGIPTNKQTEDYFGKLGLHWAKTKSNDIANWFNVQACFFLKSVLDKKNNYLGNDYELQFLEMHKKLNNFYNKNYLLIDSQGNNTAYRTIYFISKNKKNVEAVNKYNEDNIGYLKDGEHESRARKNLELNYRIFDVLANTIRIMEKRGNEIDEELNVAMQRMISIEKENKILIDEIESIKKSKSWRITKPLRHTKLIANKAKGVIK